MAVPQCRGVRWNCKIGERIGVVGKFRQVGGMGLSLHIRRVTLVFGKAIAYGRYWLGEDKVIPS